MGRRANLDASPFFMESDVAHTRSISSAVNNPAVSWTIGSKPNANSNVGCFGTRRRARKRIRDIRGSRKKGDI